MVKESLSFEDLLPEINIDSHLKFSEITPKFLRIIDQFSPFGPGNMRPVFLSEDCEAVSQPRIVGTNHIVISLSQNGSEKVFDAIGFNMGEYLELINGSNKKLDIVYSIDKSTRNGRTFPQFRIKDIKLKKNNYGA